MGAPKTNGVRNGFWRPWMISTGLPWLGRKSGKKICSFEQCEKGFEKESELKRHISSKHRKISEKCPKCDETFTRKDNLTRHVNHKHNEGSELGGVKPICIFCLKKLSRKDAVSRHQKTCQSSPLRHSSVITTPPQSPTTSTTTYTEGSPLFQSSYLDDKYTYNCEKWQN